MDKETITKAPKSMISNRVIALPDFIIDMAKHWKLEQAKYRLELADHWIIQEGNGLKYVFTQGTENRWLLPHHIKLLKKL